MRWGRGCRAAPRGEAVEAGVVGVELGAPAGATVMQRPCQSIDRPVASDAQADLRNLSWRSEVSKFFWRAVVVVTIY